MTSIKHVFIAPDGKLRTLWRLILALISWYALTFMAANGGALILMRLLDSWGVTAANLHLTPVWVQYLVSYQANLYHAIPAVAAIVAGTLLMRCHPRQNSNRRIAVHLAIGFIAAIAAALALTYLFLATDSLRPYTGGGSIGPHTFIAFAICALTAAAEGLFAFGYIRKSVSIRSSKIAGYIAGTLMFLAMNLLNLADPLGIINTILTGALLCLVAEKYGVAPVIGLRLGWLWAATSLVSFSGSENAILRLYTVSENLLTGGNSGLTSGLAMTVILAALLIAPMLKRITPQK